MPGIRSKTFLFFLLLLGAGTFFFSYRTYRSVPVKDAQEGNLSVFEPVEAASPGAIPSIDRPRFESVAFADQYLQDVGFGLDVERGGAHRFYPYQILVWHEVVNDVFAGVPLAVTYSPLCFSGMVFERTVGDGVATFEPSGTLWNNNLVMKDRQTESLWSQLIGRAMSGEQSDTELKRYPSKVMTWKEWKSAYPRGMVLSRETGYERDYGLDPYENRNGPVMPFPLSTLDARLNASDLVYGSWTPDGQARAYSYNPSSSSVSDDAVVVRWACWVATFPETGLNEQ